MPQPVHNSRFESIDTSSPSIAHECETNATTPVTYGCCSSLIRWRFVFFFFFFNNVRGFVKKRKKRTQDDHGGFLTSSSAARCKKAARISLPKFRIKRLGKNFEEDILSAGTSFLTSSLSLSLSCL